MESRVCSLPETAHLFHRYRFSGQGGFLYLQIGASGQPYIRRYLCPCLQVYQIARHQFRRRNLLTDTFPDHNGLWTGQLFNASSAFRAFPSCSMPTRALTTTTVPMITASLSSPRRRIPQLRSIICRSAGPLTAPEKLYFRLFSGSFHFISAILL